ncbi:MAG: peptidyl-prolyl cis-trans isomerase [Myxococcota bacterium]
MLRFKMFFPAACALTLLVAACNTPQRPASPATGSAGAASAAAAGRPADASPTGAMVAKDSPLTADQRAIVLARVGDHAITLGELEFRLAQEPLPTRSQFASVQKRKEYLARIVQFEVLAAEAKRRGLDQHPEVVEAAKQQMVRRLLIDALGDEDAPIQVSDAELRAYYDANPSLYHKPEQVEISHILLASAAQAEGVANELRTESKGSTARLVALWNERVSALSLDQTSAPYLGNLGLVSREPPMGATPAELERQSRVPPAVIEAAFAMEPHVVGPVVASDSGYHVLMVTSRSPAVDRTFEEVKDSIRARVAKREQDLARQKYLEALRAKTRVEVTDDAVRLLVAPTMDRAPRLKGDGHNHEAEGEDAPQAPPAAPAGPAKTPTAAK